MKDIDFALVEEKRPEMYTAMKYWGKKPHNIWGTYIENYTPQNGIVLDSFAGSAISAFESVRVGKKAVAFDINPLTSFIIEVYSTQFNYDEFKDSVNRIINKVKNDKIYKYFYVDECPCCGSKHAVLQNFKWENNVMYECGIVCSSCKKRQLVIPSDDQIKKSKESNNITIPFWYPTDKFHESPSFSSSFRKNIGNSFDNIWTKRNLYVLAYIYDEILKENDHNVKIQLLYGFIQSLHLSSKMCVPRRSAAKRGFSTSWGRSAYIFSKRQMEMNPLLLFESNCIGKQSVKSALQNVREHLGKIPKSKFIKSRSDIDLQDDNDIIYGIVDIKSLDKFIPKGSIDFIITDPPYGGLVQYVDLSCIWLVWLQNFDKKYSPNINAEITIKNGIKNIEDYNRDFTKGIKNMYSVLKDNGKIVFTFHNKDLMVWNAFLSSRT